MYKDYSVWLICTGGVWHLITWFWCNEGRLEESNSELEEGMGEGVGGVWGRFLPKHLGHETGCLMGGLIPCDQGLGVLLWVCTDSRLQGLLSVSEVMTPLPKACEGPFPGLY